jgi:opacity protein-like surface antigen
MRKTTLILVVAAFILFGVSLNVLAREGAEPPPLGRGHGWEWGVMTGYATAPFDVDGANYGFAAYLDLPCVRRCPWGDRISLEWYLSYNRGKETISYTRAFGTGPGGLNLAPFASQNETELVTTTLTINANFKYALEREWLGKFRPFALAGLGWYIFGVDLGDRFEVGQVPLPAELESRHLSAGWAQFELGSQLGGGLDYQLLPAMSIGIDVRYNIVTRSNNNFTQVFSKIGFNF